MRNIDDIRKMDENTIADDDHPDRPDITAKEFENAVEQLPDEHGLKKVERKGVDKFTQAMIDALNNIKAIFIFWF